MRSVLLYLLLFVTTVSTAQTFQFSDTTFNKGDRLIMQDVVFDFDKATIRPESIIYLDSLYTFLHDNPNLEIEISNHTDERWSEQYSQCLSCKRAESIADYLISKGIDAKRLIPKGYNDHKPIIVGAKTEEEHLINRRTEIEILNIE